jgi:hypothetical protein
MSFVKITMPREISTVPQTQKGLEEGVATSLPLDVVNRLRPELRSETLYGKESTIPRVVLAPGKMVFRIEAPGEEIPKTVYGIANEMHMSVGMEIVSASRKPFIELTLRDEIDIRRQLMVVHTANDIYDHLYHRKIAEIEPMNIDAAERKG